MLPDSAFRRDGIILLAREGRGDGEGFVRFLRPLRRLRATPKNPCFIRASSVA
jgi:hypothetical protein